MKSEDHGSTAGSSREPRVIVALDFPDSRSALELVDKLTPHGCRLKVGKELFTSAGPEFVRLLAARGFQVFLDLKFHDIPNTAAGACAAAADLGVWMLTVHAAGGRRMMESVAARLARLEHSPLLIAVTVLTSLDTRDLEEIGVTGTPTQWARRLGVLAKNAGADGIVCSAREALTLRSLLGPDTVLVTPGIRPAGYPTDDQRRVVTPQQAIRNGADYIVVGRPVTQSHDPAGALLTISSEISDGRLK